MENASLSLSEPLLNEESRELSAANTDNEENQVEANLPPLDQEISPKPRTCNDPFFALLFIAQLLAVLAIGILYGLPVVRESLQDYGGIIHLVLIPIVSAIVLTSTFSLLILSNHAKHMVEATLLTCMSLMLISLLVFVSQGFSTRSSGIENMIGAALVITMFVLTACNMASIWNRLPFASSNLDLASQVLQANYGVVIVSYMVTGFMMLWLCVHILAVIAILHISDCPSEDDDCPPKMGTRPLVLFLSLGLFWTQRVAKNIIQVTVASIIGNWWKSLDDPSSCCWTLVLRNSLSRSLTTSFGTICYGSLITPFMSLLKLLWKNKTQDEDERTDDLFDCFNKWAFPCIALDGKPFIESGKKATRIFRERGWSSIILDSTMSVTNILACLSVGLTAGVIGHVIVVHEISWFRLLGSHASALGFFISLITGTMMSNILMTVTESSFNAVVFCFGESPSELRRNHADCYLELREAWRKVYPDESSPCA